MAVAIEKPTRFTLDRACLKVVRLKRYANGEWRITAGAEVQVTLKDGRQVVSSRVVVLRAQQVGRRKPR